MPNWIITPDKYLSDEEVNKLIRTCSNAAEHAAYKDQWVAVRDWMIIDLALNTQIHVPLDFIDFQGPFFRPFLVKFL